MPALIRLALSAAAATTAPSPSPAKPICPVSTVEQADATALKPRIAPLGAMPPARRIVAVLHKVGGCEKPIVVNEAVSANRR